MDDDPAFRELAGRYLADAGITVAAQADTVAQAITIAEETRPDAILVDVDLPDGDGVTLAHRLTSMPWQPQVILTSVDPDAAAPDEVRRSGALAFLSKDKLASGALVNLLEDN
ncbi:MAG TPA: response regulator transcription factor [Solirubrobacterales bacterium]|nr:response regulator transcription factor [Solirubrobacterales bacterium]